MLLFHLSEVLAKSINTNKALENGINYPANRTGSCTLFCSFRCWAVCDALSHFISRRYAIKALHPCLSLWNTSSFSWNQKLTARWASRVAASLQIDALVEVVEAVQGRVEVYLDGGIRKGSDVLKALALGAKCVFIGRPALWGLAYKVSKELWVCTSTSHTLRHSVVIEKS